MSHVFPEPIKNLPGADIPLDGVLQPHGQQDRFDHDLEQLRKK